MSLALRARTSTHACHTRPAEGAPREPPAGLAQRTFERLGLPTVICQADAGAMGGSRSEEFLHPTEVGEDTFEFLLRNKRREYRAYDAQVTDFEISQFFPRA